MSDLYGHAFADNLRLAKSKRMDSLAADIYHVIQIPRFAFVLQTWLEVLTVDADATLTVGYIGNKEAAPGDVDAFMTNTECALAALGMKTSLGGTGAAQAGKYFYDGSGSITVTLGGTFTGAFIVFADYVILH